MATRPKFSEAALLEQYRVALNNVENQPEAATKMAEHGYDTETVAQGKTLLASTLQFYNLNKTEDDETSAAHNNFATKRQQLAEAYADHREKAKIVFRKDAVTADRLAILGSQPQAYIAWLGMVKKFYSVALSDTEIQTKLSRLKLTLEDLNATNTLIEELETARTEYLREEGESQAATKTKDAAFAELDDWMSEFYAVAKIALKDNPQLLESLGKLVVGS